MPAKPLKKLTVLLAAVTVAGALGACGPQEIDIAADAPPQIRHGAELFYERCSGCHTLDAAASEGSAISVHDVERVDGPNFNERSETVEQVLYAIRNGGFSGAIMPQNIVVGEDAVAVAEFVAEYSGNVDNPDTVAPGK